ALTSVLIVIAAPFGMAVIKSEDAADLLPLALEDEIKIPAHQCRINAETLGERTGFRLQVCLTQQDRHGSAATCSLIFFTCFIIHRTCPRFCAAGESVTLMPPALSAIRAARQQPGTDRVATSPPRPSHTALDRIQAGARPRRP